jgi:bacterioferritin
MAATKETTIQHLKRAYSMELETVANYLANSMQLDGVRAEEIKNALAGDITEELSHAQRLAQRIKQLGGRVPGSLDLRFDQSALQPPEDPTQVQSVIEGVLAAENAAIDHYNAVIRETDGADYVTQDLCIKLLAEEEAHRTQFEGFRKEYKKEAAPAAAR